IIHLKTTSYFAPNSPSLQVNPCLLQKLGSHLYISQRKKKRWLVGRNNRIEFPNKGLTGELGSQGLPRGENLATEWLPSWLPSLEAVLGVSLGLFADFQVTRVGTVGPGQKEGPDTTRQALRVDTSAAFISRHGQLARRVLLEPGNDGVLHRLDV